MNTFILLLPHMASFLFPGQGGLRAKPCGGMNLHGNVSGPQPRGRGGGERWPGKGLLEQPTVPSGLSVIGGNGAVFVAPPATASTNEQVSGIGTGEETCEGRRGQCCDEGGKIFGCQVGNLQRLPRTMSAMARSRSLRIVVIPMASITEPAMNSSRAALNVLRILCLG